MRARYAPKPLHKDLEAVFAVLHQPHAIPTVPPKTKVSTRAFKGKDTSFFWAGELTPSHRVEWNAPNDDDYVHSLQVKLATLAPSVESNEVHLVEVETTNIFDRKVKQPWIKLVGGVDNTVSVGVSFNSKVTFRLLRGKGPVYLSGQHLAVALFDNGDGHEAEMSGLNEEVAEADHPETLLTDETGASSSSESSQEEEADPLDTVEESLKRLGGVGTIFGLRK